MFSRPQAGVSVAAVWSWGGELTGQISDFMKFNNEAVSQNVAGNFSSEPASLAHDHDLVNFVSLDHAAETTADQLSLLVVKAVRYLVDHR